MKSILIIDDDVKTSSKYKKWLEDEEGFNSTLINDPQTAELNFKSTDYDLVLIGFKMSVMDGFNLYDKLHELSKKLEDIPKEFRVCFMTSSRINYQALADIHPEFGEECYVSKEVSKDVFIKHVNSLIP
ncbi:MAG TPA: response regulator [Nitrososphaeraceae archaeon]|nr:response regulator [Nitrososphaeraceae archaeon]